MSNLAFRQGTDSKFELARQSFVRIMRHKQEMEEHTIKLLRHVDATADQVMMVRQWLLDIEEPLGKVVRELRKQYPYPTISLATRPWHRQEYNKYETSVDKTRAHDSANEEDSTTHEEE